MIFLMSLGHDNVPRIGLVERIEGHDPSGDGIEGPSPSEYAHELSCLFLLFIYNQASFQQFNVKLF